MGLSLDDLDPPLDDIAFLARSNNRLAVLEALAGGERTRRDLRDATGTSQPTIGRILEGFDERGWVEADGRTHSLSPLGRLLLEAFDEVMDTVRTVQTLADLEARLPLERFDFDLDRLADARITTPSPTDAARHVRREQELAERADHIRFFCNSAHPHTVAVYRDRVVEDGQHLEAVIAAEAVETAGEDPEMGPVLADLLAADRTSIYRYDGVVDLMVGRLGDTAVIQPLDEHGLPCAIIDTEDEAVREWVDATIDEHLAEATPMGVEAEAE